MKPKRIGKKSKFKGKESRFDDLKLYVLDENEMHEIIGGGVYYVWIDGKLVLVKD